MQILEAVLAQTLRKQRMLLFIIPMRELANQVIAVRIYFYSQFRGINLYVNPGVILTHYSLPQSLPISADSPGVILAMGTTLCSAILEGFVMILFLELYELILHFCLPYAMP